MSEFCNVAWPCGREAIHAMKVYDTVPRFSCHEHTLDMTSKGAELRPLSEHPGPWVVPSIHKEGEIKVPFVCPTCRDKVCRGGLPEERKSLAYDT